MEPARKHAPVYDVENDEGDEMEEVEASGLVFTDDRHTSQVLHSLNMMRRNRTFCDVVLHVGKAELHAHRAVLASASPHLLELFSAEDEHGTRESVISYKLNGAFEKHALEQLIDYAYTARLELSAVEVRSVFVAATQLKMERVARECANYLVHHLSLDTCLETRRLPGIARDPKVLARVDQFIASKFEEVRESASFLSLPCVRIELLSRSKEEMALVTAESVCHLALDWVHRAALDTDHLVNKTHMLYLALDNSLQDCSEVPTGDASDTEMVQHYKRLSKSTQSNKKGRKSQNHPKPRVTLYSRNISDSTELDLEADWKLIASSAVGEHTMVGLVTMEGKLGSLSVVLRLNSGGCKEAATGQVQGAATEVMAGGEPPATILPPQLYHSLAAMASFKCAAGCANLNDSLLVCGGYDRAECLRSVELYSPSQNAWASLAPMLEARGRFNIAVVEGRVYAVGGCNGTTELATVERLNTTQGHWTRVASLPMARSNTGVCSLGGKIYCIGGWNGQVGIKQCDVFDPATEKWTSIAPLLTGRYQAGVCAMNGKVWVVGGCDGWNCLSSVEVYDPATDSWSYAPHMITARRGSGVALFNERVYAVGGSDGTQSLSSIEVYDPDEKTWSRGPDLTTPRSNVGVAVIGPSLYAVGGFSGKMFLNSIELLDEGADEWTTFSAEASGDIGALMPSADMQPDTPLPTSDLDPSSQH